MGYAIAMSPPSPPEPPSPLDLDEWIAILVTLTTIGGIFYWAMGKEQKQQILQDLGFSPPSPQPDSTPESPPPTKPTPTTPELSESERISRQEAEVKGNRDAGKQGRMKADSTPPTHQEPSSPTPTTPTPSVEFSDVPDEFWAKNAIATLAKRNIVVGFPEGEFKPQRFATRGELAVMLQQVFKPKSKQRAIAFKDLPPNYWGDAAIKAVAKAGIIIGYPDHKFRPNQPITRAEALVVLAKALNLKPPSEPSKTLQKYADSNKIPDYAIANVAAAVKAGLVTGYPRGNLLNPNKPATRAELAAMLHQAKFLTVSIR
ncbi:S-layer domain protein [Coleofasciculus chthonoplastes PCC 7420]|uniref:S-layer domain protein n=1 Tax=Coleofasciculus chthonoplastes PCC 7420 TaxID=118168 RepID=B4VLD9_9CYAN|nr:S-layer homology domain-containing protein [Coleofasciculus chthonoplastes]EDX77163.1 S-layer domain protein [Coleofasciculus chthonoplastes PCC 7420]